MTCLGGSVVTAYRFVSKCINLMQCGMVGAQIRPSSGRWTRPQTHTTLPPSAGGGGRWKRG